MMGLEYRVLSLAPPDWKPDAIIYGYFLHGLYGYNMLFNPEENTARSMMAQKRIMQEPLVDDVTMLQYLKHYSWTKRNPLTPPPPKNRRRQYAPENSFFPNPENEPEMGLNFVTYTHLGIFTEEFDWDGNRSTYEYLAMEIFEPGSKYIPVEQVSDVGFIPSAYMRINLSHFKITVENRITVSGGDGIKTYSDLHLISADRYVRYNNPFLFSVFPYYPPPGKWTGWILIPFAVGWVILFPHKLEPINPDQTLYLVYEMAEYDEELETNPPIDKDVVISQAFLPFEKRFRLMKNPVPLMEALGLLVPGVGETDWNDRAPDFNTLTAEDPAIRDWVNRTDIPEYLRKENWMALFAPILRIPKWSFGWKADLESISFNYFNTSFYEYEGKQYVVHNFVVDYPRIIGSDQSFYSYALVGGSWRFEPHFALEPRYFKLYTVTCLSDLGGFFNFSPIYSVKARTWSPNLHYFDYSGNMYTYTPPQFKPFRKQQPLKEVEPTFNIPIKTAMNASQTMFGSLDKPELGVEVDYELGGELMKWLWRKE